MRSSSSKHSSRHSDRQCLRSIIRTIDAIQATINIKLQGSVSKPKQRSNSLKNSRKRTKTQANFELSTKQSNCNSVFFVKSSINNNYHLAQTPRKKKKSSLKDNISNFNQPFDSPFDRCVFEQSCRTKKLKETPKKYCREKREKQNSTVFFETNKHKKQYNWKESSPKKQKSNRDNQDGREIEKYYANQREKLKLQEEATRMEEQFESCLVKKKTAPRQQQLVIREKMYDLSVRIVEIRERQARLICI